METKVNLGFGRVGELMLEYLKKNSPSDMKIISISKLDIKWEDDYIGRSGEHYMVEVKLAPRMKYSDETTRTCYVKKSAFQEFADQQNNIIWE